MDAARNHGAVSHEGRLAREDEGESLVGASAPQVMQRLPTVHLINPDCNNEEQNTTLKR